MLDDREHSELDARLRAALAPDDEMVARVVTRALATDARSAPSRRRQYAIAAVVVAVVAGLAALGLPSRRRGTPPAPTAASLSITGRGSLLAVDASDGRRWIVGAPADRAPTGAYVIVVPQ